MTSLDLGASLLTCYLNRLHPRLGFDTDCAPYSEYHVTADAPAE
jgi:hypothetical protein